MTSSPDSFVRSVIRSSVTPWRNILDRIFTEADGGQHRNNRSLRPRRARPQRKPTSGHGDDQGCEPGQDQNFRVTRPYFDLPRLGRIEQFAVDAHRIGDVLQALLAQADEADLDLVHRMVECIARDADTPRLGHGLEAGGDVESITVDIAAVDDDSRLD